MVERVAIGSVETPIGTLWAACSEQRVWKVSFPREGARAAVEAWLASHMPQAEAIATSALLEQTLAELREYFDGNRQRFTLPLALRGNAFQQRVWEALARIPYGQTVSYGDIARQCGTPHAARAVGAACGANPVPIIVP